MNRNTLRVWKVNKFAGVALVRGYETLKAIKERGIDAPNKVGDPAFVLRELCDLVLEPEYAIGLVPHYIDKKNPNVLRLCENKDILLIDIQAYPDKVIQDMGRCRCVASSSLHGFILADLMGIPAVRFSTGLGYAGDGIKWIDYVSSVKGKKIPCLRDAFTIEDIKENMSTRTISDRRVKVVRDTLDVALDIYDRVVRR